MLCLYGFDLCMSAVFKEARRGRETDPSPHLGLQVLGGHTTWVLASERRAVHALYGGAFSSALSLRLYVQVYLPYTT